MVALKLIPVRADDVVGRVVDDEAVLVLPEKGKVKVLNEVGAYIWSLIDGGHTVGEIAQLVCGEYEVELEEAQFDTGSFIQDLANRGIVSLVE